MYLISPFLRVLFFFNSLSLSRPLYFPTLYQIYVELEGTVFTSNSRVRIPIGADTNVFPSYSGVGYAIFPAYKVLLSKHLHKIFLIDCHWKNALRGSKSYSIDTCYAFFKPRLLLPDKRYFACFTDYFLSTVSVNLLVFYHECRSLIGHATRYLFCDR